MSAPDREREAPALEAAAEDLRARHQLSARPPRNLPLRERLADLSGWLARVRERYREPEPSIAKASDWLLDNSYLLERAIRQIQYDLPDGFYARLPRLSGGEADGLPRMLAVAHGFLRASRLQVSLAGAARFVDAYQGASQAFTIGELWAFPALLRLCCVEILVAALLRLAPDLAAPAETSAAALAPSGLDDTDCVGRSLANLGVIDAIAWKDFFQCVSRVESALAGDPAGVYARMDFETRDQYRRVVERLAREAGCLETEVAARVVEHAHAQRDRGEATGHVGYWLIGPGAPDLAREIDCQPKLLGRVRALLMRHAVGLYALALLGATGAAIVVPSWLLGNAGASGPAHVLGLLVTLLPASVVSFTAVHWLVTRLVPATRLPKLDFSSGIPADCRTVVTIPALVHSEEDARALASQLEAHFLANPDPALEFVLLTDCADAHAEELPEDAEVVAALRLAIRGLNARHGASGSGPFHLLHRRRQFNPQEGVWMGWERKRGKLEQLNELLAGEPCQAFAVVEGETRRLANARFVITLDADTRLPLGTAQRLTGTLAHPLNRAVLDPASGRVRSGYTVIQPRVEIAPEAGNRSWFARLYSGDTAIDIYTAAVSDVYQDLFGSGIFVGKGIYEVQTFRESLAGRVPERALASHDLFEGAHGRAALASDIVLYEGFPSHYESFARRWHRWVRSDWQLVPWLLRRVPGPDGARLPNPLSWLDRWKILDNLRRSLLPPALLAMLAAGWLALPGSPWAWTALGLLAPAAYLFTDLVTGLARGRRRGAVRGALRALLDHLGRWSLAIVFLAADAWLACDAVGRTLWRVFVSRRGLLEWTPAAQVEAGVTAPGDRARAWRTLAPAAGIALSLTAAVAIARPSALVPALPILLAWLLSPEISLRLGRARVQAEEELSAADVAYLRTVARRTWLFFERLIGPEDHWLPPDNLQEVPREMVAHRTSPTNVGMALLSTLAAADFGYLGPLELAVRVRNTLGTLDRLSRVRGHFLNWYDTRSLEPLEPRYISTVDSGNLAVSLIALKEGCRELADGPVLRAQRWDGLHDELALLREATLPLGAAARGRLLPCVDGMSQCARRARQDQGLHAETLAELEATLREQLDPALAEGLDGAVPARSLRELRTWLDRVHHGLRAMRHEADELAPWLTLLQSAPAARAELASWLRSQLPASLPIRDAAAQCARAREALAGRLEDLQPDPECEAWETSLVAALEKGGAACALLAESLAEVARRAEELAFEMDFRPLYDPEARRFRIGFNVSADRPDPNHYDLLASEARLASFFAIAKADAPPEHWFHLGRPIVRARGGLVLLSWGGSMFEYLMPPLLLRSEPGTLLAQSERAALETQRRWARELGIPWGMSESAFASFDPSGSYRYQSFGVPGLGLRRGLARDRVVAPYATALALGVRRRAAVANLRALERAQLGGALGFYDAADFTPARAAGGASCAVVRTYMAHHQGMILAALDNALFGGVLVRRFYQDLRMRATELLLHERIPRELPPALVQEEDAVASGRSSAVQLPGAWAPASAPGLPAYQALGNGRLASWISASGAGALVWHGTALTRWRPDATRDADGLWLYLRDESDGRVWMATPRSSDLTGSEERRVLFEAHVADLRRREAGIATRLEVSVAPSDDVEIRRLSVTNESAERRTLTITSYAEVALAPPRDDERHPAFSKLFVEAEWIPALHGLLFRRRARSPQEHPPVFLHRVLWSHAAVELAGFEASRAAFLGRGGSAERPRGVVEGLRGTLGATLDPALALALRVTLDPYERVELAFLSFAGGSRETVLEAAERYATLASLDWATADAAREAARELERLGLEPDRLPDLQALLSLLLSPSSALAADAATRRENRLGQPRLWGLGISGDDPILLLRQGDAGQTELLELLLRAHALWRARGVAFDLVLLRLGPSGYVEAMRDFLAEKLAALGTASLGQRAGVHLVYADQIRPEERRLLECAARAILDEGRPLADQLRAARALPAELPPFSPPGPHWPATREAPIARPQGLSFDNGVGGFTQDGREYVIFLEPGAATPAPWSNVLANDDFGCLVTESGLGFTWAGNSGENRLTRWSNDPVVDPPGEALYLRDEQTGASWSVTPQPAGDAVACEVRHGSGFTRWLRHSRELTQELRVFVPPDAPVKIVQLRLENRSAHIRRITATYWAEWLLGALPSVSRPHVVGEWAPDGPALLARNPWSADFGERVAFLTATRAAHGVCGDRREFLGANGDPARPAALGRWGLSGRVEAGADPGAAYQVHLDLAPGAAEEVSFVLGQGADRARALALVSEWRAPERIARAEAQRAQAWEERLGAVRVQTPEPAFDLLVNRWLLYQALGSRVMARAGFHQASGAVGFRDQLQDVLALLHCEPARARAHLLRCAAHQFEAGDVMHWWHPPSDRGVRTRCSDDLLWLPWAVSQYVAATGDAGVLDERVPFLRAPELEAAEPDRYARYESGPEAHSLFEHCERALERGVTSGRHGLPRIGAGDWNDGFDRLGARGAGESVWLGWFSLAAMRGFAQLCEQRCEPALADRWRTRAVALEEALSRSAWDGAWFVRAFDDDGRSIGSSHDDECRIDSIAQSWAVLSGAHVGERAREAVRAARRELAGAEHDLVRLFWPPFDATPREPGYVKAYPPGVRENGGQYAHAAAWLGLAFAELGDGDAALEIFDRIHPIKRTGTRKGVARYRGEPYVLAGDVGTTGPLAGRAGWTWYTGAAGWSYRLGVEGILGLRLCDGKLAVRPCLPRAWSGFEAEVRGANGSLRIRVRVRPDLAPGSRELRIDGALAPDEPVAFPEEGVVRTVELHMAQSQVAADRGPTRAGSPEVTRA